MCELLDKQIANNIFLIDGQIKDLLPKDDSYLSQAMRYGALSPGKRIRSFILLEVAKIFDVPFEYAKRTSAAIEIVHSYSLIHDDLPAMDNDDYRRGLASCHKKFDEAAAILAGDALLTLAFEILSDKNTHPNSGIRCELINILSRSIGAQGIAGGQMLDIIYERTILADNAQLVQMQFMKTAKLFMACAEMAAVLGGADDIIKQNLIEYAKNFGLAFQFIDDLEDIAEKKEIKNNNIVNLIGADEVFHISQKYIYSAHESLVGLEESKVKLLQELAKSLIMKIK